MTTVRFPVLVTTFAALACSSEAAETTFEEPVASMPVADTPALGTDSTVADPAPTDPTLGTAPAAPAVTTTDPTPAVTADPPTPDVPGEATGGAPTMAPMGPAPTSDPTTPDPMDPVGAGGAEQDPIPMLVDLDLDGVMSDLDCDDEDPASFPGIREGCNGKDNDCDGTPDNDCIDVPECKMEVFEGRQYAFCNDPISFPAARDQCHVLGLDSVSINSEDENAWVNDNNTNADTWIGATDAADITVPYRSSQDPQNPTEGTFRWIADGSEFWAGGPHGGGGESLDGLYSNWGTTGTGPQPNNLDKEQMGTIQSENCTVIRQNMGGRWADIGCTNRVGRATCEQRQ